MIMPAGVEPLPKIISGGQTGVDQVFLRLAAEYGFPTGGTAPKGWRTDVGPAPWLADYGLVESHAREYVVRTIKNVRDADMTIWFGNVLSPGGQITQSVALHEQRRREYHFLLNPSAEEVLVFLGAFFRVNVVNGAGNRLRTNPEASQLAQRVLDEVFRELKASSVQHVQVP